MNKKNRIQVERQEANAWVKAAIQEEDRMPNEQLWKGEPTSADACRERERRVKFLRKHARGNSIPGLAAELLSECRPKFRCYSGTCPECGRLFQRWFVRQSRTAIQKYLLHEGHALVAVSIVPPNSTLAIGYLQDLNLTQFNKILRHAFEKTEIDLYLGAVDFAVNVPLHPQRPMWVPHLYVITSVANRNATRRKLKAGIPPGRSVRRRIKISTFQNVARRRSYACKMTFGRRTEHIETKNNGTRSSLRRNTGRDRLRAPERLELFLYLHRVGFASRMIFQGAEPKMTKKGVVLREVP